MASVSGFDKTTTCEQVVESFATIVAGKTILITGVSPNGLGEAMAKALADKRPARLIFAARSMEKAEAVANDIRKMNPTQNIEVFQMDLSSNESVRTAAMAILSSISTVDILINNAGVMALPSRTLSVDGREMHFATNFLGHFLFTRLLEGKFSNNARIVNVTSGGYMVCPIRFHDLDWSDSINLPTQEQPDMEMAKQLGIGELASPGSYNPMLAYLHSNTASMLFTAGLNRRLGRNAVAISAAPGVAVTELQRHLGGFRNQLMEYKTASQGAASFLIAALDPGLQKLPNAYVDDCQVAQVVSDYVKNDEVADRLWAVAEAMTDMQI